MTFAPKAKSVLAENPDYHLDEITASDIVAFGDDGYTGFNLKFSTNSIHNCYAGLMEWDEDYFYLKEGDYTDNPCCFVSYRSYSTLNSISIELKDGASLPSGVSIKAFYNATIDTNISYLESMDEIYYEIKKIKEYVCKEKIVNSMSNIFANGFEFYFEINLMCNKFRKNVSHNYLSAILYV